MLKSFIFYIRLTFFCLQLFFNLTVFSFAFLFNKLDQKKILVLILSLLILINFSISFYIFSQKNTPKILVKQIPASQNWLKANLTTQKTIVILNQKQLEEEISSHERKNQEKINSLGLFLNLSQLNKALKNQELSTEYLHKAKQIEPQIN